MVVDFINQDFWKNKKVFVTGNTGFKGSWLVEWLILMGSEVAGFSLPSNDTNILFNSLSHDTKIKQIYGNINNYEDLKSNILSYKPEIVFHLAAQPLVRKSYNETLETLNTNIIGTANLLESIKTSSSIQSVVVITSDKCYENIEKDQPYSEEDSMGGHDPYSASKGCAELVTSSYRRSFFDKNDMPSVSSVRAGNVIGGGDWSDDRLIPDAIKAFLKNENVYIRYPNAIRPWQDVLDPIFGYLILAEKQWHDRENFAQAWNFGPEERSEISVKEVIDELCANWGNNMSWIEDNKNHPHEAGILKLNSNKSKSLLNWAPQKDIHETIHDLVNWYKLWIDKGNISEICGQQIQRYLR